MPATKKKSPRKTIMKASTKKSSKPKVQHKISIKKHVSAFKTILAACDHDLLGCHFEQGELVLDVPEHFYKGEIILLEKLADHAKDCDILNLVGEKTVSKAIELGLINAKAVIKIGGVKHAQRAKI